MHKSDSTDDRGIVRALPKHRECLILGRVKYDY